MTDASLWVLITNNLIYFKGYKEYQHWLDKVSRNANLPLLEQSV